MSVNFDGLASKSVSTLSDLATGNTFTVAAWALADGGGEGGLGFIVTADETRNSWTLHHAAAANTWEFFTVWTGNDGTWTFPATDGIWHAVSVSYNGSSTANDPIARLDFASAVITETVAPTLAFTTAAPGYCIGNRDANDRTWDGMISHVQVFNVILTSGEMDQCLKRPGSVRRGLKLWAPLYNAAYLVDLSGNAFNGTGTALTNRIGGPPCGVE